MRQQKKMEKVRLNKLMGTSRRLRGFCTTLVLLVATVFSNTVLATENPSISTITAYNGRVQVEWVAITPAPISYHLYASQTDFSDVSSMTPSLTISGEQTTASLAGLLNNTTYYFGLVSIPVEGQQNNAVTTISATPEADSTGPEIETISINGIDVQSSNTVTTDVNFVVDTSDPSGLSRVEFYVEGVLLSTDMNTNDGFHSLWPIAQATAGSYQIAIKAIDTFGNETINHFTIDVENSVPSAPKITSPENLSLTNNLNVTVTGTSSIATQVQLRVNNAPQGERVSVSGDGSYNLMANLQPGTNSVSVDAIYTGHTEVSPDSNTLEITVDTGIPNSPVSFQADALSLGRAKLNWFESSNVPLDGYNIYRSETLFKKLTDSGVEKVNDTLIPNNNYIDLISQDGLYFFAATSVSIDGKESALSNVSSVAIDSIGPEIISIEYSYPENYEPVSNRIGTGQLNFSLELSEPITRNPYFAIVPSGSSPIVINLKRDADNPKVYSGRFNITPDIASGIAYLLFSGSDKSGNRGTEIKAGAQILIDTKGPEIVELQVSKQPLIDNNPNTSGEYASVSVNIKLSDKADTLSNMMLIPLLNNDPINDYIDGIALDLVQDSDDFQWTGTILLPPDAGLDEFDESTVEQLSFSFTASDDLNNLGTEIQNPSLIQVFQGSLPPADAPTDFRARALPEGKAALSWEPVVGASQYKLYRKTPNETEFLELALLGVSATSYIDGEDSVSLNGVYEYVISSIREGQGTTVESAKSEIVNIVAVSEKPNTPNGLEVNLTSQGVVATWNDVAGSGMRYNLYQVKAQDQVNLTVENLKQGGLEGTQALDNNLTEFQSYYVVTAIDAVGNESLPSSVVVAQTTVLPVTQMTLVRNSESQPLVKWQYPDVSVAGFNIYREEGGISTKLNDSPVATYEFLDSSIAVEHTWNVPLTYSIKAEAQDGTESLAHSLLLPMLEINPEEKVLLRGVFNWQTYLINNFSNHAVEDAQLNLVFNVDGVDKSIKSYLFNIPANSSSEIDMAIGGDSALDSEVVINAYLNQTPNEGELIQVEAQFTQSVMDDGLVAQVLVDDFIYGGIGKASLVIENTSELETQLIMAYQDGHKYLDSDEIRLVVFDDEDNVLATQAVRQFTGNVVEKGNAWLANVAPGEFFESEPVAIAVADDWPEKVNVRFEIDQFHFKYNETIHQKIDGLNPNAEALLESTSYYARVDTITPTEVFANGDGEKVTITGQAIDRVDSTPLSYVPLDIILRVNGFERRIHVITDADGNYTQSFEPRVSETGRYQVSVVHPQVLNRPNHGQFVVKGVGVTPGFLNIQLAQNYKYQASIYVQSGSDTALSNVRLEQIFAEGEAENTNLYVELPEPVSIGEKELSGLVVNIVGRELSSGMVRYKVLADEFESALGIVELRYTVSNAVPSLITVPSHIEAGVKVGENSFEVVTLQNKGVSDLVNATITLEQRNASANTNWGEAPSWISLASNHQLDRLSIGEETTITTKISPPDNIATGDYEFRLKVYAQNLKPLYIPIYTAVTQSGEGSVKLHVSDMYTGEQDENGNIIPGVQNAKVTLQSSDITSQIFEIETDSNGYASVENVPAGVYDYRVSAFDHYDIVGTIKVNPGLTSTGDLLIENEVISVEFEVKETAIQDQYITNYTTKFETDVPIAVLVFEPATVELPVMNKGQVFTGELTLTNYGLASASGLHAQLPSISEGYKYEFLGEIPETLQAGEVFVLPYRVIALEGSDRGAEGDATGGGNISYSHLPVREFVASPQTDRPVKRFSYNTSSSSSSSSSRNVVSVSGISKCKSGTFSVQSSGTFFEKPTISQSSTSSQIKRPLTEAQILYQEKEARMAAVQERINSSEWKNKQTENRIIKLMEDCRVELDYNITYLTAVNVPIGYNYILSGPYHLFVERKREELKECYMGKANQLSGAVKKEALILMGLVEVKKVNRSIGIIRRTSTSSITNHQTVELASVVASPETNKGNVASTSTPSKIQPKPVKVSVNRNTAQTCFVRRSSGYVSVYTGGEYVGASTTNSWNGCGTLNYIAAVANGSALHIISDLNTGNKSGSNNRRNPGSYSVARHNPSSSLTTAAGTTTVTGMTSISNLYSHSFR